MDLEGGTPQGGSMSAILFAGYINDLLLYHRESVTYLGYADDTPIKFSFKESIDWHVVESEVSRVVKWSQENGMLLNAGKSNYMVFSLRGQDPQPPIKAHVPSCRGTPECQCDLILNVAEMKYLGMTIDEQINWKSHISAFIRKLRAAAVVIAKLSRAVNRKSTIIAYKALFESLLRYGILAYGAAFPSAVKKIESVQNQIVKRIVRAGRRDRVESVCQKSGILPFRKLYLKCLLIECTIRNPRSAQSLIDFLGPTHDCPTRSTAIRPTLLRLVRSDNLYVHKFAKLYRKRAPAVDAITTAVEISREKRD